MKSADVLIENHGSWGKISLRRTGSGNALNESSLREIFQGLEHLELDSVVQRLLISGTADAFMLGADLPFFARCLIVQDVDRILRFTQLAHLMLERIEISPKPIVAWVEGAAYGAGLELALACDWIVASPFAKFSLPETGLGIYPGMGGTQRTGRRIGCGLAKWMIFTGSVVPAEQALEIGLIDAIQNESPDMQRETPCFAKRPRSMTVAEQRRPLSPRFQQIADLFSQNDLATLLDPAFAGSKDPNIVRALIQMRRKAPLALRFAELIIDHGARLPLRDAIALEFSHLREIFSTEDARTGVQTLGRKTPEFVGR